MTLTLELEPEEAAILEEQAQMRGVNIATILHDMISQMNAAPARPIYETATPEEWENFMDELALGGEAIPVLPPEAYDRENLYEDRL